MRALAGVGIATVLVVAAATVGCGDVGLMAQRYRAEKQFWQAKRAEEQARLTARPDSVQLLRLRKTYQDVRASVALPATPPAGGNSAVQYQDLYRTLATAELQGARLAMEARRPDLALESVQWISDHAGSDTTAARQADVLMFTALRAVGRYDDAVAKIHQMLAKYPPRPVENGEDAVLSLPDAAIEIRQRLGDQDGLRKEQQVAVDYYRGLLAEPHPGELTARIRSKYVRALLGMGDSRTALAEAQRLEDDVRADTSLSALVPDVAYVNAKVHAVTDKDHAGAIALLRKVAAEYPKSNVAGPATLEAGLLLEDQKDYEQARQQFKAAAANFPGNLNVAPVSLYRQAMLEDRLGNWTTAKAILESIPVKYPATNASAEAPIAIAQHYARVGDKAATTASLQKAVETYRQMIAQGVPTDAAATYRWDILQCQLSLKDFAGIYAAVDDLVANHPGLPFTAQALIEGAKVARAQNLKDRAAGYLERFLQDYPNSPAAANVRTELRQLGG